MSSKRAASLAARLRTFGRRESGRADPGRRAVEQGRRRAAMTTRLTAYYTIAAVVLIAAASARFYFGLERSMDRANWEYLDEKTQTLAELLRRAAHGRSGIDAGALADAASSGTFSRFLLRIVDGEGRVLVETPGIDAVLPIGAFPQAAPEGDPEHGRLSHGRRSFLLESLAMHLPTLRDAPPQPAWQIEAALDVSADGKVLSAYLRQTAGVLAAAVLIASAIGALIARRGLRPITDITRATERIGVERLHERIGEAPWPRELTALASAFDRMLERLQESFARLSQFSADLAHELRTPINNLMGEAQVALSHERTPREYIDVLQSALEEQARLARMIDSMLFLAYADDARSAPGLVSLDARAEVEAVADFYQALAEEQGIELACEGGGRLQADPQLLRRALSNLVSNALKYTPRGGRVTLRAGTGPRGEPLLAVTDTGIGVAPEHLPRLGDRLYRVDPSRSGAEGSGLGLSIVKSIMALHDGKLEIESTLGSGTRAALRFPPAPPSPRGDS